MIKNLLKRYKQGIHPCMLLFLIQYFYDPETKAMYDGNHIYTDLDTIPENNKAISLWEYGLQPLLDEFVDLNDEEKQLLTLYVL